MGADEQLGGYARHRSRFKLVGICCLINPMDMKTLIDLICFLVKKDGKDWWMKCKWKLIEYRKEILVVTIGKKIMFY